MSAIALFRRVFYAALLAGLCAGTVAWATRQITTMPLIQQAEKYEQATTVGHDHGAEGWQPADGPERILFTLAADLLTGIAFALILGAAVTIGGAPIGWRSGLIWGLAGFAAFSLAPALGLPPDLPGSEAAALPARQAWWTATVALTAGGLALARFAPHPVFYIAAAILIALPHLIGAPQPQTHGHAAPDELVRQFAITVLLTNALFWLALGAATGFLHRRMGATT